MMKRKKQGLVRKILKWHYMDKTRRFRWSDKKQEERISLSSVYYYYFELFYIDLNKN